VNSEQISSVSDTFSASTISDLCMEMTRAFVHNITIATELAAKHLHTHNNNYNDLEASLQVAVLSL
jgi:hypothetical protein